MTIKHRTAEVAHGCSQLCRKIQSGSPLSMIKQQSNITELSLVQKGSRLSIMPVAPNEFEWLLELARKP